jgi:sec-independent protein translocase protein TatB
MFDIGFSELLIVALVGLVVLGPKRLPEVARTVGQWVAKVRRFVSDVKQDIDREMQHSDLTELRNLKQELDETRRVVEETSGNLIRDANVAAPLQAAPDTPAAEAAATASTESETPPRMKAPPARKKRATKRKKKPTTSKTVSKTANGRSG